MTQGIRDFAKAKFQHYLPVRAEIGNTEFRKSVMADTIIQFGITVASAATHYNHALKEQRKNDPASVADLGRDPAKKGGAKPKHLYDVVKVKDGTIIAAGLSKSAADEMVALAIAKKKAKLEAVPVADETAPVETAPVEPLIVPALDFTDATSAAVPAVESETATA